jgi:hypothetical protein
MFQVMIFPRKWSAPHVGGKCAGATRQQLLLMMEQFLTGKLH